jgi:predicted ABC-type ATPase
LSSINPGKKLRLRIFAGPNGSGKSTVIKFIRKQKIQGRKIDFGIYINADDIALKLTQGGFSFKKYKIETTPKEFKSYALASGLIHDGFSEPAFLSSFKLRANSITLLSPTDKEYLAQLIADFLRKKLLRERKKFSFETVFSHEGKLDFMQEAVDAGYKVYLYFVSTESKEINVFRVQARKKKGGHDVPEDKIRSRYDRSMEFMFEASRIADQSYFFDNSGEKKDLKVVAEAKKNGIWPPSVTVYGDRPNWFIKYYSIKELEYLDSLEG